MATVLTRPHRSIQEALRMYFQPIKNEDPQLDFYTMYKREATEYDTNTYHRGLILTSARHSSRYLVGGMPARLRGSQAQAGLGVPVAMTGSFSSSPVHIHSDTSYVHLGKQRCNDQC